MDFLITGEPGCLAIRDHPAGDVTTEDIENHVQVVEAPFHRSSEFVYVPAPELIGGSLASGRLRGIGSRLDRRRNPQLWPRATNRSGRVRRSPPFRLLNSGQPGQPHESSRHASHFCSIFRTAASISRICESWSAWESRYPALLLETSCLSASGRGGHRVYSDCSSPGSWLRRKVVRALSACWYSCSAGRPASAFPSRIIASSASDASLLRSTSRLSSASFSPETNRMQTVKINSRGVASPITLLH